MNSLRLKNLSALLVLAFALGAGNASLAQTEPEEELELIVLGNSNGEEDPAGDEEIFDGLVFDQDSQRYRLIEDPEEENLVEPPSQRETDTAEIIRLFALYKQAVGSKNFLEADTLAKQIVVLSIGVFAAFTMAAPPPPELLIVQPSDTVSQGSNVIRAIYIGGTAPDGMTITVVPPIAGPVTNLRQMGNTVAADWDAQVSMQAFIIVTAPGGLSAEAEVTVR